MKFHAFRLSVLMLISLLISACGLSGKNYQLALKTPYNTNQRITKNKHLRITVSKKLPSAADMGGSDFHTAISYKNVISWLRKWSVALNKTGCVLSHKTTVNLSVIKLYTELDSENLTGTLVIQSKFSRGNRLLAKKRYRGVCETSFLWLNEKVALQNCMNSAFNKIIPRVRKDLCRIVG